MKRRIVCLFLTGVFCAVLLVGCGKDLGNTATPVTEGFTCEVSITYRDMELKGQLSRTQEGRLLVTLSEPPSLSGIAISWDGEEMAMELGGLRVPVDAANVPQGALVKCLLSVLSAKPSDARMVDGEYTVQGDVDGKAYTIICEPDTGLIRSLTIPDDELTVMFSKTALLTQSAKK